MRNASRYLPFWAFMAFFKIAGGLHYSLLAPLGERVMPVWAVGLIVGASAFAQLLLDLPAGQLLDRHGYKRMLAFGTACFGLAGACLAVGLSVPTFLASIVASTFGWLFFGPGVNAYVLSHAPRDRAGGFISLRDVAGSVGIVVSSASLPFVILFSTPAIGLTVAALFVAAFALISVSPPDTRRISDGDAALSLRATVRIVAKLDPASTLLLLLNMAGATFYGVIWFVVPLVIAHQASAGILGIGLGVFDLSVVALGFFLGTLADRVDRRTLVFFGLLLFALCGASLGLSFGWMFLLFGFLATTGDEMAGISLWSWLHALDHEHRHDGVLSGALNITEDLGPAFAGIAYGAVGPSGAIALGSLPIFITFCAFIALTAGKGRLLRSAIRTVPRKPHRPRHRS